MQFKKCLEIGCHFNNLISDYKSCETAKIYCVEPVKSFLNKVPNKKNIVKLNYAVTGNTDSIKNNFFYISENVAKKNNLPEWATTMGSLLSYHPTINHFGWEYLQEKIEVPCISLKKLIDKYCLKDIDFLHIDTEGYDYKILMSAYENRVFPEVIKFESKLMSSEELSKIISLFSEQKYMTVHGTTKDFNGTSYNTILYKNQVTDELLT